MNRLINTTALVFGAGSGIGLAVARRFAQEGAQVIAAGLPHPHDHDYNHDLALPLLHCDVTREAEVQRVVAAALEQQGRIDILVNSAGVVLNDEAAHIQDHDWSKVLEVNLTGSMRTMRAVLPHMQQQQHGVIVNIASVAAFNPASTQASYAAAKSGLVALTRSVAHRYGSAGIRANALCPGWVDSPMSQREMQDMADELHITPDEARTRTVARIALGRMASADEMASAVLFLASDEASFITGATLVADGGLRIPASARGF